MDTRWLIISTLSVNAIPYEIAEWIYKLKINLDCHIIYAKNRYSCPYQHVGKEADLKITDTTLVIYIKGERVATHNRFPEYVSNRYSTHDEDMPDHLISLNGMISEYSCSEKP